MEPTEKVRDALAALHDGVETRLGGATVDVAALAAHVVAAVEGQLESDPYLVAESPSSVVARRMKELRGGAGLSRRELGEIVGGTPDKPGLGLGWTRDTVTDVEIGRRRLWVDEVVGLAVVFGVPVATILNAVPGEAVAIGGGEIPNPDGEPVPGHEVQLGSRQYGELLVGRGGSIGRGGPNWQVMADVPPAVRVSEVVKNRRPRMAR